jgi:8-oxo-dGTP pyrophosphatase MutT (NUDIX family)
VPEPIRRTTARVVPVNRDGQVLLLHGCDPRRPETPYWFTIGGGTEPGESLPEAGARELAEETGIVARPQELIGPYHRGVHEFEWNGLHLVNDSHFFAIRLDDVHVTFEHLEEAEIGNVFGAEWFAPDALPAELSSNDLPALARLAVEVVAP